MLVAVVDGNPLVNVRDEVSNDRKNGACPPRRAKSWAPRPSTRTTTALRLGSNGTSCAGQRGSCAPGAGTPRLAATDGSTAANPVAS
ncbi:hypothetical protein KILIM_083_00110 [Kineosphaera limosa NBRC 100340]|uniref:Uncharacterized protein n=1 Tax=Kineosphaera limosa NBRC 100340 TaxID=1184609 RepID=K6WEX8_9MICO|nr:hypothetical protein KILIM_083_00110 [Kineosphaera limosa NBRC 100340]